MAFSTALRREASSVSPLAIRALGNCQSYRSALQAPRGTFYRELHGGRAALFPPLTDLSSLGKKPTSETDLLRVIDSEIKFAQEDNEQYRVDGIAKGFPFKIQDYQGTGVITLRRSYQGENIEVVVSMPQGELVCDEEEDDDEDKDGDDKENSQICIPLSVNISKGEGTSLEFSCTAYPDKVTIDSLFIMEDKDPEEQEIAYAGPDFSDLDENLQKALQKHLEMRGITASNTNLLQAYMVSKDSHEYLLWLKKLKQFVET